jgi:hypothetical protein
MKYVVLATYPGMTRIVEVEAASQPQAEWAARDVLYDRILDDIMSEGALFSGVTGEEVAIHDHVIAKPGPDDESFYGYEEEAWKE